jgi:TM2 domain-containing membrane protein YozV
MANPPTDGRGSGPEPEIIPPDRARREFPGDKSHIWVSIEQGGAHRLYIRQPGFFTIILLLLLIGVILAALIAVFLGAFLILVPAVIIIVFALVGAAMVRAYFNRLWSSRTTGGSRDDLDIRR